MKKLFIISAAALLIASPVFAGVDFNVGDAKATLGASVWVEAGWDYQFHGDVPTDTVSDNETQQYMAIDDPSNINLKVDYKNLGAYTEIRFSNSNEFNIELYSIYGKYSFDDKNSIMFGKASVAFSLMAPKQNLYNSNCLDGYGGLDPWKESFQVRYSYKGEKLGLDLALEEAKTDGSIEAEYIEDNELEGASFQVQNYFPAFVLNFTWKPLDTLTINPSGYIQQYQLKPKGIEDINNTDVLTYALSLGIEANLKPVNIQVEGWYGQNMSVLEGIDARPAFFDPININGEDHYLTSMGTPVWDGNKLKDVITYGGWLQVEAPIKNFTPRIGGGYQRSTTGYVDEYHQRHIFTWGAFANCDIKIKEYLNVCPEFLYMFNGQDANKNFLGNGYSKLGYEAMGGVTLILSF
jgi:hypothetical protein